MRTINEIYEELLEAFSQRCGFRPEESCDLSVRLYAAAAQVPARPMRAPVNSSWSSATSSVLPQTPALPVQAVQPAVCSH